MLTNLNKNCILLLNKHEVTLIFDKKIAFFMVFFQMKRKNNVGFSQH